MGVQVQVNQVGETTAKGKIRSHELLIDRPESKGGGDAGAMGGELLLASLGGCFMSNLLAAIKVREAAVSNVQIAIEGELAQAPSRFESIRMVVAADHDDPELLQKLVTMSERACIVANTLRGSVDLSVEVALA